LQGIEIEICKNQHFSLESTLSELGKLEFAGECRMAQTYNK
jgi:hypothetical protein